MKELYFMLQLQFIRYHISRSLKSSIKLLDTMSDLLEIDGSVLEGGGQILRISVSLSAVLSVPIRVTNIRAGRSKPGLAAQHLKGIELVAQMCQAKVKGANLGSTQIEFIPGKIRGGNYVADTKTAGSISLLLQVALPVAFMASGPVKLDLYGGTNASMAPQIEYMGEVFRYIINKFGPDFSLDVHKRGYYPRGGGHVTVETTPVQSLTGVQLVDRGDITSVYGWSYVAGTLPVHLAHEMARGAREALSRVGGAKVDSYKEDPNIAVGNCSGINVIAESSTGCLFGADGLGSRAVPPLEVGRQAGAALATACESGACVDEHMQDQLIIYMTLARGKSSVLAGAVTLHTRTAIHVAELMAKVKFDIRSQGENNIIECTGLGFLNKSVHNN